MQGDMPKPSEVVLSDQSVYDLAALGVLINDELATYFSARSKQATRVAERYGELWQILANVILHGGKRLRPYLMLVSYQMYGGRLNRSVIRAACAQELLHQALLVHDDIIDRDYVRHGILNVAGQMRKQYQAFDSMSDEDSRHFANGSALIAGDGALGAAFDILRTSGLPAEDVLSLQALVDEALFITIGGELLDSESVSGHIVSVDPLAIARLKTATYSCIVPLLSGAQLAGAGTDDVHSLRKYGEHAGIVFQFTDDLLGVFGDEKKTGKSTTSDLEEGKHTFLMQHAREHGSAADRAVLNALVGKKGLTKDETTQVKEVLQRSGARTATVSQIQKHAETALQTLDSLHASRQGKEALRGFVRGLVRRTT